jgi:hypothetical protein
MSAHSHPGRAPPQSWSSLTESKRRPVSPPTNPRHEGPERLLRGGRRGNNARVGRAGEGGGDPPPRCHRLVPRLRRLNALCWLASLSHFQSIGRRSSPRGCSVSCGSADEASAGSPRQSPADCRAPGHERHGAMGMPWGGGMVAALLDPSLSDTSHRRAVRRAAKWERSHPVDSLIVGARIDPVNTSCVPFFKRGWRQACHSAGQRCTG